MSAPSLNSLYVAVLAATAMKTTSATPIAGAPFITPQPPVAVSAPEQGGLEARVAKACGTSTFNTISVNTAPKADCQELLDFVQQSTWWDQLLASPDGGVYQVDSRGACAFWVSGTGAWNSQDLANILFHTINTDTFNYAGGQVGADGRMNCRQGGELYWTVGRAA